MISPINANNLSFTMNGKPEHAGKKQRLPDGDIAKTATIYNSLGATKVSNYGARVVKLKKDKPWEK